MTWYIDCCASIGVMQDAYWSINFELLKDLEILCSKKGKQSKTNESYDEKDSFPVQKSVTGVQTIKLHHFLNLNI